MRLNVSETVSIARLWLTARRAVSWDPNSNVIVSLTSFPARIGHAWIAIESLFQQDLRPWKIVLVLSEDELPNRSLPRRIRQQEARGLEILWTEHNARSFNKLLPVREKYPDAFIATVDDDTLYEPWRLRKLVEASDRLPGAIIGHRGWLVTLDGNRLEPYVTWPEAGPETPPELCFLTGVGGVLYPPHVLPLKKLLNMKLALELCPSADDIWFWAVAREAAVPVYCLGNHEVRSVERLRKSPALHNQNWAGGQNDAQLNNVMNALGVFQG